MLARAWNTKEKILSHIIIFIIFLQKGRILHYQLLTSKAVSAKLTWSCGLPYFSLYVCGYTVKKDRDFTVPIRDVTIAKLSLWPRIVIGTGKWLTFFYSVWRQSSHSLIDLLAELTFANVQYYLCTFPPLTVFYTRHADDRQPTQQVRVVGPLYSLASPSSLFCIMCIKEQYHRPKLVLKGQCHEIFFSWNIFFKPL